MDAVPLQSLQLRLHRFDILAAQLLGDDVEISHRIRMHPFDIDDAGIVERAANVEDRIAGGDVRQERVAQTLTVGGALHEGGNVDKIKMGRLLADGCVVIVIEICIMSSA